MRPGPKLKDRKGKKAGTRVCVTCKQSLPRSEFYRDNSRPDFLTTRCRDCMKEKAKHTYKKKPGYYAAASRKYHRKIREEVIAAYGGRCACCGDDAYEFLAIDHVKGGGLAHRRSMGGSFAGLALHVKKRGFPKDFRILCHNCNMARGFHGACPHEKGQGKLQLIGR